MLFAPCRQSIIDWSLVLKNLQAHEYHGWLSVENFDSVEQGPDRLVDDIKQLQTLLPA